MLQASSQLAAEVSKVSDFLETTREKKKWSEETVRSLQGQLRTAHKRMLEVKKSYEARCREEIQAAQHYHQEVSRSGRDSSLAERAHSRHAKVNHLRKFTSCYFLIKTLRRAKINNIFQVL